MGTISERRADVAAALNTIGGITVTDHPVTNNVRPGNGWVNVIRLAPADFTASAATMQAVVILSPDPVKADEMFDDLGVQLVDAVTGLGDVADVSAEPMILVADGTVPGNLYAIQLTFLLEVTR
jgi:hypothetical protein